MTTYLTVDDLLDLHDVIREHAEKHDLGGGPYGLAKPGELESALGRPRTTLFGEEQYPTLPEKVAVLTHSLIRNHCFRNGNKRTALLAAVSFLRENGYELAMSQEQVEELQRTWAAMSAALEAFAETTDMLPTIVGYHLYLSSISGFASFLADPKDEEITWSDNMGSRDFFPVEWNWEKGRVEGPALESRKGLSGAFSEVGEVHYDHILIRGLSELTFRAVEINHGDRVELMVPDERAEWLESLPDDEAAVANIAMHSQVVIRNGEGTQLSDNVEPIRQSAETHFGIPCPQSKLGDYKKILAKLDDEREIPEGLSIDLTIEEDGESHQFTGDLVLQIHPLYIDETERSAYFPAMLRVDFGEETPGFEEIPDDELYELSQEFERDFKQLNEEGLDAFRSLSAKLLEVASNLADEFFDENEEDSPDDTDLEAPAIVQTGSYEPMWKFLLRIEDENLAIDEIASWFESRMRPLRE